MMISNPLADGIALIFDMDGVIVDSNPLHRESWTAFKPPLWPGDHRCHAGADVRPPQ